MPHPRAIGMCAFAPDSEEIPLCMEEENWRLAA